MKKLALILALALVGCANVPTAPEAPAKDPIRVGIRCVQGQTQVLIGAEGPGSFLFTVPKSHCGTGT